MNLPVLTSISAARAALRRIDELDDGGVVKLMEQVGSRLKEKFRSQWTRAGYCCCCCCCCCEVVEVTGLFVSPRERDSTLWAFSYDEKGAGEAARHPRPKENKNGMIAKARLMAKKFDPAVMKVVPGGNG